MHDRGCIWWDQENNVLGICDCSYSTAKRDYRNDYGDGYKDGFYRALRKVQERLKAEACSEECLLCAGLHQAVAIIQTMELRLLGQEQE